MKCKDNNSKTGFKPLKQRRQESALAIWHHNSLQCIWQLPSFADIRVLDERLITRSGEDGSTLHIY